MKSSSDFEKLVRSVNSEEEFERLEYSTIFSSQLINARLGRNLSQSELAKLCGMKQSAIARIENGTLPRIDTVLRIAKALDIEVNFFTSEKDISASQINTLENRISSLEQQLTKLTENVASLIQEIQTHNQINITIDKSAHLYSRYPVDSAFSDSMDADYVHKALWPRESAKKGAFYADFKL